MKFYNPKRKHMGIQIDQILSGGGILPGRPLQQIQEESATQNYDIGTRLVEGDRVFRYCKAGTAIVAMMAGHCGNLPTEVNTHAVISAAGTDEITILDTTAAGSRPVDYYAGGYIWVMNLVSSVFEMLHIKGSTVGDGTSITLTLVEPLIVAIPATTWITAWPMSIPIFSVRVQDLWLRLLSHFAPYKAAIISGDRPGGRVSELLSPPFLEETLATGSSSTILMEG